LSDEKKINISAKPFFRTDLRVPAKWQYQKKKEMVTTYTTIAN